MDSERMGVQLLFAVPPLLIVVVSRDDNVQARSAVVMRIMRICTKGRFRGGVGTPVNL